jgi:hypothetical protein
VYQEKYVNDATDNVPENSKTRKFKKPQLKIKKTTFLITTILVLAIGIAAISTFKYMDIKNNPQKVTESEQKSLISKISKHIELPDGEQPSIATVSDKEKLKDQAFFKDAQNGDTVLIYTNAKEAILYRESEDKVVKVAPIAIDTTQTNTGSTPTATTTPSKDSKKP